MWPRAILLDLDGTLVDSFPALGTALDRALAAVGHPPMGPGWVAAHVGHGLGALLDAAVPGAPAPVRGALEEAFRASYEGIYLTATPPLPGVPQALAELAHRAVLGVVSNKPVAWSRGLVQALGWSELVGFVAGPETSGAAKPAAAMVDAALLALAATRGEAILVGDMTVDVATGRAAAIPVVGVHRDPSARAALVRAGAVAALAGVADLRGWLARAGRGWEE